MSFKKTDVVFCCCRNLCIYYILRLKGRTLVIRQTYKSHTGGTRKGYAAYGVDSRFPGRLRDEFMASLINRQLAGYISPIGPSISCPLYHVMSLICLVPDPVRRLFSINYTFYIGTIYRYVGDIFQ